MDSIQIHPGKLPGSLTLPSSKSQTLRAILFAALASGRSQIIHPLTSPDTDAMLKAVELLGAQVQRKEDEILIDGFCGKPKGAKEIIDCGNSGLVLRLIGALAGLIPQYTILTGDHSICYSRVAKPLLQGLSDLGCFATSSCLDGYAPLIIKGPITNTQATLHGEDSQPVSGLLILGAFAPHPIELHVLEPGEKPWIDLTLHWLEKLNIPYIAKDYTFYRLEGNSKIKGFTYVVPGDLSTMAFPLAAALITQSELTLHNVDMEDLQGDKKIVSILQRMGAKIEIDAKSRTLVVKRGSSLQGISIDLNDCIDALPILAVIGCFAKGRTEIFNAKVARKKESDRIFAITKELKKMGALIEEKEDGIMIEKKALTGAFCDSHQDHRIALSLAVAALAAKGPSTIHGTDCIKKTYPSFMRDFGLID